MKQDITNQDLYDLIVLIRDNAVHKDDFNELKNEVKDLSKRVGHIENHMVTKEYLDHKLADIDVRKPMKQLIDVLVQRAVITVKDKEKIIIHS